MILGVTQSLPVQPPHPIKVDRPRLMEHPLYLEDEKKPRRGKQLDDGLNEDYEDEYDYEEEDEGGDYGDEDDYEDGGDDGAEDDLPADSPKGTGAAGGAGGKAAGGAGAGGYSAPVKSKPAEPVETCEDVPQSNRVQVQAGEVQDSGTGWFRYRLD